MKIRFFNSLATSNNPTKASQHSLWSKSEKRGECTLFLELVKEQHLEHDSRLWLFYFFETYQIFQLIEL